MEYEERESEFDAEDEDKVEDETKGMSGCKKCYLFIAIVISKRF